MEELLYEGSAFSEKNLKTINLFSKYALVLGVCCMFFCVVLDFSSDLKMMLFVLGMILVAEWGLYIGVLRKKEMEKGITIKIYSNHVEGTEYTSKKEFSIGFDQIFYVKTTNILKVQLLVINANKKEYLIELVDPKKASLIINQKLDELEKIEK